MNSKKVLVAIGAIFIVMVLYLYGKQDLIITHLDVFHQANYSTPLKLGFYTLFIMVVVFVPIPLGGVSRILAGILFGFELGLITSLIIMNSLALFQVFIFRHFKNKLNLNIDFKKVNMIKEKIQDDAFEAVIWLRVIFIFPYQITNMALSFTNIKYRDFYFGSILGEVPITLFYTFVGQSLVSLKNLDVIKEKFWLLLLIAAIYSILILLIKHRRKILRF